MLQSVSLPKSWHSWVRMSHFDEPPDPLSNKERQRQRAQETKRHGTAKPSQMVRLRSMCFEAGVEFLKLSPPERKIHGFWVENPQAHSATRLRMFREGKTKCVSCGLEGTHWHIERHRNDAVMPFSINLYGMNGYDEVMLTWDHILPKSLGGSNSILNAQCMCAPCNMNKSNKLSLQEMVDIATHPSVLSMYKAGPDEKRWPRLRELIKSAKEL